MQGKDTVIIVKIILCGFMGCGKTSIGWRLAERLNCKFVDMDQYIEFKENMKVADIFAQKGEKAFRQAERLAAEELMALDHVVIATGGGTVLNPDNVEIFHRGGGVICFLDVPIAALQERLRRDVKRPLLQRPDRREFITKLHAERYPRYKVACDRVIDAGAPAVWIAKNMAKQFSE